MMIVFPETPANLTFGDPDLHTIYVTARTSIYRVRVADRGACSTEVQLRLLGRLRRLYVLFIAANFANRGSGGSAIMIEPASLRYHWR